MNIDTTDYGSDFRQALHDRSSLIGLEGTFYWNQHKMLWQAKVAELSGYAMDAAYQHLSKQWLVRDRLLVQHMLNKAVIYRLHNNVITSTPTFVVAGYLDETRPFGQVFHWQMNPGSTPPNILTLDDVRSTGTRLTINQRGTVNLSYLIDQQWYVAHLYLIGGRVEDSQPEQLRDRDLIHYCLNQREPFRFAHGLSRVKHQIMSR